MGIFDILKNKDTPDDPDERQDSVLFSTAFAGLGVDASLLVPWEARAAEIDAKRLSPARGTKLLQSLWAKDRYMQHLEPQAIAHLEQHFDFASVPAGRDLIRQDEYGNFMIVLLSGSVAVDRVQPWGERLRLAEIRPGEILGEMSLLDSGIRFSACMTTTDCEIAVMTAEGIDEMMAARPQLAAYLIALLARKLSLRLRVVSARLSEKK
jgi:CRP/FNR family transcriptional regulator, cyclic AMP receptor protein